MSKLEYLKKKGNEMGKIAFRIDTEELSDDTNGMKIIKSVTVVFSSHGWFELHDTQKRDLAIKNECWKETKIGNLIKKEIDDSLSLLANGNKLPFNIDGMEDNKIMRSYAKGLVIAYFNWNKDFIMKINNV